MCSSVQDQYTDAILAVTAFDDGMLFTGVHGLRSPGRPGPQGGATLLDQQPRVTVPAVPIWWPSVVCCPGPPRGAPAVSCRLGVHLILGRVTLLGLGGG